MSSKKYFKEPTLPNQTVKEINSKNNHFITLGDLKKLIERIGDSCSDDTLVAIERLPDALFTDGTNGWRVVNCLWDRYVDGEGIAHDSFCDAVPIFNFFLTTDVNGDEIILATPHY